MKTDIIAIIAIRAAQPFLSVLHYHSLVTSFVISNEKIAYLSGLIKMKDLLRISSHSESKRVKMSILQFDPHFPYDPVFQYQKILKEINKTHEHNVVISLSNDKVLPFLKEAARVQRMTEYDNYMIVSLDIHTLNLSEFQSGQTNITGLTLLDPKGQDVGFEPSYWHDRSYKLSDEFFSPNQVVSTTTALLYDALNVFAKSVQDLQRRQSIHSSPISCESREPWPYGTALINSIKMV